LLIGVEPEEENIDAKAAIDEVKKDVKKGEHDVKKDDEGEQILASGQNLWLSNKEPDPFEVFEVGEEDDFDEKPGENDKMIDFPKPFKSSNNNLKVIANATGSKSSVKFVE
jgi:hypothetical protein